VGTLWYRRCTVMRMSGLDLRATKTQLSQALGPWIQLCCRHRSFPRLRRFDRLRRPTSLDQRAPGLQLRPGRAVEPTLRQCVL